MWTENSCWVRPLARNEGPTGRPGTQLDVATWRARFAHPDTGGRL
jgi:hypothetical protein